jgi:hypothetical protein
VDAKNKSEEKKPLEDVVKERIAALEKERDNFVLQANNQVAAYNGAIGELKRLIEPETAQINAE